MQVFAAIDFETANFDRKSACAVGLVRVENGYIVARESRLIKPRSRNFRFTDLHHISCDMVAYCPTFDEVWQEMNHLIKEVSFFVAHNAPFDRSVLHACCAMVGIDPPRLPFLCTLHLTRVLWGPPADLAAICERLGISLQHHDPGSDAEAAARIALIAMKNNIRLLPAKPKQKFMKFSKKRWSNSP